MAISDIEGVLEFLRKNGLNESESALMEDIIEKSELGSVDIQKFVFPLVSPPPPIKILSKPPAAMEEKCFPADESSSNCSDEFLSMASSFTDLCSSGASSVASSDRLSQFSTARDYHEFDVQNDLYCSEEKEEDCLMPPCFEDSYSYGGPSEDKFVMTFQMQSSDLENVLKKFNHSDNLWPYDSIENVKAEVKAQDYYALDESVNHEGGTKTAKNSHFDHSFCVGEAEVHSLANAKENGSNYFHFEATGDRPNECVLALEHDTDNYGDITSTFMLHTQVVEKGSYENTNGCQEGKNDKEVCRESDEHDIAGDEGSSATGDELIFNTNEEDYEVFDLRIIHRKNRTGFEENKDLPIVINSMIAGRYYVTEYLGSAAFSRVVQAHDILMGVDVCLKIIKNDKDFFDQSLDEIKLLKFVNKHDPGDERHILRLYDYFYHQEHLFIVCELLRSNLYEFQKYNRESGGEPYFTMNRLQVITRQCLEALDYLHDLGIIHCDLKPENILIKSYTKCEIKVIDLGSSCFQTDNLSLYVQSRSYRAPEVILGHSYDQKIDQWSLGCILAEFYSGEVLFPNEPIAMLLARVIGILGPIDMEMLETGQEMDKYFTKDYDLYHINEETNQLEYLIPEESSLEHHLQICDFGFIDFLRDLLEINPLRRPTAREALEHPWLSYSYDFNSS